MAVTLAAFPPMSSLSARRTSLSTYSIYFSNIPRAARRNSWHNTRRNTAILGNNIEANVLKGPRLNPCWAALI
jgi:hypothetical protein